MNFTLFFSIFSIVMTSVLGGLLIWLHFRLNDFKAAIKKMPLMEEQFTSNILSAKKDIQALETFAREKLPSLDSKLTEAKQAIDEIDYMLSKTEKSMDQAETTLSKLSDELKTAAPTSATIQSTTQSSQTLIQTRTIEETQQTPEITPQQQSSATETPKTPIIPSIQQQAYTQSANFSLRPQKAINEDGTPSFVSESISRSEMHNRNKQSSAEQSLRKSLAEILK